MNLYYRSVREDSVGLKKKMKVHEDKNTESALHIMDVDHGVHRQSKS